MKRLPKVPLHEVFKNRERILRNPLPFHNENFEKFGDSFKVKIGLKKSVVFTRNPEIIQHVLQKQHKKYHKSPLQTVDLAKYVGHGLLTSNGDHWLTHRRMIQPAFHKQKLIGLLESMKSAIQAELRRIQPDKVQDIFPVMGDLAFQVVAKSLFSRNDIQVQMAKLKNSTEANQKMLVKEMRQPYFKWWFNLSGEINKHIRLTRESRGALNQIIDERVQSKDAKDDLLYLLLAARYEDGSAMSREQLIDEVLILFTAGHETTANALGFTLFLLATHQEKQQKAFQEISKLDFNVGDTMENISKMTYIKQCIEEGLRMYPPAYYIDRIAVEEDTIQGRIIPKNTMILMSIYELHRYADFWENPNDFIPERFDRENKKDFSGYYFPFGAGPRMCIGNNFAMYEMILTIGEILKNYYITTPHQQIEINPLISLKPKEVPLKFIRR